MSDVKLIESPRDAWAGLRGHIPTSEKVSYLKALFDAGFQHVDAFAFLPPKTAPQMSDSEDVLRRLEVPEGVEIMGLVLNEKGAERAAATGKVQKVAYSYSLSETFLRKQQEQSPEENSDMLDEVAKRAYDGGMGLVAYVSMAFGNPYGDPWNLDEVMQGMDNLVESGAESIVLADTTGSATTEQISEVCGIACVRLAGFDLGVHLHARKGDAQAKLLAAYDAGIRRFDASLGGIGGCPLAQDATLGNLATEGVIAALETRGVGLAIHQPLDSLISLSRDLAAHYAQR